MNVILLMIPVSLLLAGTFLFLFLRTLSSGQLDDLETPAHRMLMDHERKDQQ